MVAMNVPVTRPQGRFLASEAEHVAFIGGVGSGKTRAGAYWAVRELCRADGLGFVGANTHAQLVRVTLRALTDTLDAWRIPYTFGKRPPVVWGRSPFQDHSTILSARIHGRLRQAVASQLTTYDYLRGIEIRWAWVDEARDLAEDAFHVLLGRKRGGAGDARRPIAVTTTPDGFNWLYDAFVSNSEKALPSREVIYAHSRSNPWLPPGYVDGLLASYSPRLAQQEIEGRFVSLTSGMAFAEFSRAEHVRADVTYNPDLDLIHAWDFNVNPLCSVILQEQPDGEVWAIDEIHIAGSARTWDATDAFLARYKDHRGRVRVYGDASGRSGKTSAKQTDYDLVEEAYRPVFGSRLRMNPNYSNPPVHGSVQDVNSLLRSADGRVRLRFSPRCEYTIRDLEQVAFRPGTRDLDKSDPELTHHSDALRYYISMEFPACAQGRAIRGATPSHW